MQAFHLLGPAPFYTNSFLLISDAGHAVIIDPAAEVQEYDKILKEHNAQLTTILCTTATMTMWAVQAPSAGSIRPGSTVSRLTAAAPSCFP